MAAAAYLEYVGQPRPGVAAWRFPPHSLATNTLALLLKVFTTPAVLIALWSGELAVAGLLTMDHTCYPNTRRSSVLLSLGGAAMHPPTFSSLVDAYAFHHSQDAQKYHAYIDEERPDLNTRPADFQPTEKTKLTYGFLIVQHIHDRKAPWTLSPLLLPPTQQRHLRPYPPWRYRGPTRKSCKNGPGPLPLGIIGIFTRMSCPLSKPSVPPPFSPISSARWHMINLRPVKVLLVPLTPRICWTFSSPSSPFMAPSLALSFKPRQKPWNKSSRKVATAIRVHSLAFSIYPLNSMNAPLTFTRGLSSSLSAFLRFLPLVFHSPTFMPWRRPYDKLSCVSLLLKHLTSFTRSYYLPCALLPPAGLICAYSHRWTFSSYGLLSALSSPNYYQPWTSTIQVLGHPTRLPKYGSRLPQMQLSCLGALLY